MKKFGIYKQMAAALAVVSCMVTVLALAGCGSRSDGSGGTEAYQEYVVGIMDANYLGQYEKYMEITGSAQAEAERIYEANVQTFALEMAEALSVKTDVVTKGVTEQFIVLAGKIYGQVKYQPVDVVREGDIYTVSLEVEPIDFRETVREPFQSAVDTFNEQAKNGDFDGYTDQEYEEAYGQAVAAALGSNVNEMVYQDKTAVKVVLDYDKENNIYFISDEEMEALDNQVVNIAR
ncbi:MAG: hypothetical protein HFI66_07735 [Lachnospiraceae bacterium]|nr:hypothetical protein [Lachnospiraceae bacterium]